MEETLCAFLRQQLPQAAEVRVEAFRPIAGGYSREMFYAETVVVHNDGRVEKQALFLRRDPPSEMAILNTSRLAEHQLLNRIRQHTHIPVPRSLYLDAEGAAFGRPAMLLERALGSSDLTGLLAHPERLEAVATDLCEKLADLHTTDPSCSIQRFVRRSARRGDRHLLIAGVHGIEYPLFQA